MHSELNKAADWSEFTSRMRHQFEALIKSQPRSLREIVQELRQHDESITFLDGMRDNLPEVKDMDLQILPAQMQRHGYYASLQGPWLVCSKSKRQHDSMLFAAQAAQVLAEANMAVVPLRTSRRTESSVAA
jgi:hypothetical protein